MLHFQCRSIMSRSIFEENTKYDNALLGLAYIVHEKMYLCDGHLYIYTESLLEYHESLQSLYKCSVDLSFMGQISS